MKEKSLIILFICLCCTISYAQQQVVFSEDFEGYDHEWKLVNNQEFKVKQEEGVLVLSKANENKVNNGCLWYEKTIPNFYTDKNFSIAFEASVISNESDTFGGFDFQWGKIVAYDGIRITTVYQLDFAPSRVRLARFELKKGWKYYQWSNTISDAALSKFSIDKNAFNKFEIIQDNGVLMVKVNGQLVYKLPIEAQIGNEIGFQQCLKGEWKLDNLIIKQ